MTPSPPRILVVDDDDAMRENLAEALDLEGYAVATASGGAEALDLLSEDPPPRVVLLDLHMPGIDGREVIERIRSDPRLAGVRVVVSTGMSGTRTGADALLVKPFGVRDLLAALRKVGLEQP